MDNAVKLPQMQQELLDAMRKGAICHFMPYAGSFNQNAYYFRSDTMRRCTAQAKALLNKGLVEKYDQKSYNSGHKLRALSVKPWEDGPEQRRDANGEGKL